MHKDYQFLAQGQRFEILKAISAEIDCATRLAQELNMSVAYASQQLKLMEAYGIIARKKITTKKIGKPAARFEIIRNSTALCHIGNDGVFFHNLKAMKSQQFLVNAAHLDQHNVNYFLFKMFFLHEQILLQSGYVSFLEASKHKIHVFIITDEVEVIRKKFSTIHLQDSEGNKMDIALWSHTMQEVISGLEKKEKYFFDKLEKSVTLLEKNNTLKKLKNTAYPEGK